MEGFQELQYVLYHHNLYQNFQSVILLDVQKVELYWVVYRKQFQYGCILHTKIDTSVFKGRRVCLNIQTLNWICFELSKWES
jgi:hypothetical protein